MNIKTLIAAAALAAIGTSAFAGDQTVLALDNEASFIGTKPLLDGGDDVITFAGIGAGTYDFLLTLSGPYVNLTSITLNGVTGDVLSSGKILFASVEGLSSAPFSLTLTGSVANASKANYSGELSLTPVPEPETYALMLGGLAAVGFMARRRKSA